MGKKEKTSKEGLFAVLDVLEALGIKYWVEGGWGVDILTGRQNREHRDIDIDFDGRQEALLLEELKKTGYVITTDSRFLGYELIICLNTALLCFTGMEKREGFTAFQLFMDRQYLNNSFVFGPTDDMGAFGRFIGNLTLPIMKVDVFSINNGQTTYWPVIWLLFPSYILFVPLYLFMSFFFNIKGKIKRNFELAEAN